MPRNRSWRSRITSYPWRGASSRSFSRYRRRPPCLKTGLTVGSPPTPGAWLLPANLMLHTIYLVGKERRGRCLGRDGSSGWRAAGVRHGRAGSSGLERRADAAAAPMICLRRRRAVPLGRCSRPVDHRLMLGIQVHELGQLPGEPAERDVLVAPPLRQFLDAAVGEVHGHPPPSARWPSAVPTRAACSAACAFAEPDAGAELSGRATTSSRRPSSVIRCVARYGQAPMLAGSSWTQVTVTAFG